MGGRAKPSLSPFQLQEQRDLGTLGILAPIYLRSDGSEDPSSWASLMIRALERDFASEGGRTLFFNTLPKFGPYKGLSAALYAALERNIDALLIANCEDYPGWTDEIIAASSRIRIPFLYIAAEEVYLPFPMVYYDQRSSGYLAAQHLQQSGYDYVYVIAPFRAQWFDERIEGVQYAMRSCHRPEDKWGIIENDNPPDAHEYAQLLPEEQQPLISNLVDRCITRQHTSTEPEAPFALIAPNDAVAELVLARLTELQIAVGSTVGVVGFDDSPAARNLGLTSIPPPLEVYGKTAAALLARGLRGDGMINRTGVGSYLIPRNSTHLENVSPMLLP
jgi:DNA-binding LacI/PurR family transcriptional regulator